MDIKDWIADVPDFPQRGILFRDITPLLREPKVLEFAIDKLAETARSMEPGLVLGVEARGFLFGAAVASKLGIGFVPVRKPGKLPRETVKASYALEYGEDTLEIHRDAVLSGDRVVVVDDLLATGGTALASARLVESLDGKVAGLVFLIELSELKGRRQLEGYRVETLVSY